MSVMSEIPLPQTAKRVAPWWLLRHETMLAAILIAEIASALVFINVSPYWIRAVQGLLILVTVIADILRRRRMAGA